MTVIDLRSDTVTRPSVEMRRAMASAEVGDDVYGEDPSVRALEERVAELLGKEAALFVPSGTACNQIAILLQTRRGDEVIVGEGAHCAWYESGAAAALGGIQFMVAGTGGLFDANEMEAAMKPSAFYFPRTSLVALENTHNRAGGKIFPQRAVEQIATRARAHGLSVHLDGARLWNAAVATGQRLRDLAGPADTVGVCFSKGLGAPVGSALAATTAAIAEARRFRRMLGGAMRQAGILAAAASYAIEHHVERLALDHEAARTLAERLSTIDALGLDPSRVETNIVRVDLPRPVAASVVDEAHRRGVLLNATGPSSLRLVTHMDCPLNAVETAAACLVEVLDAALGEPG
jgi:threonine aldolase